MDNITERMRQVMESKGLNAKGFAELLGIQRSGLSHIYSGRNKPGLDLIQKILEVFPEVSADWLLTGKGSPDNSADGKGPESQPHSKEDMHPKKHIEVTNVTFPIEPKSGYNSNHKNEVSDVTSHIEESKLVEPNGSDLVTRLILLNENGTFTMYNKA
jgi:transcriptional regulator with XRE-family HTH domain